MTNKKPQPRIKAGSVIRHENIDGLYVSVVSTERENEIHISSEYTEDGMELGIQIECESGHELAQTLQTLSAVFAQLADMQILKSNTEVMLLRNHRSLNLNYLDVGEVESSIERSQNSTSLSDRAKK